MASSLSSRVVKAMGVFGGVQVVSILCSIVRVKLVAVWIGAVGVGLFGIFNNVVDFISQLTLMGVNSSATRDVARCDDDIRRASIVTTVRRWCAVLGLLGSILTLLFAPQLSSISFGDTSHAGAFRWLSLSILFMAVANGELAVLQGLSRLRRVALANLCGAVGGTLLAVPLFYYFRVESIVPVIIGFTAFTFLGAFIYRDRGYRNSTLSWRTSWQQGRSLITLGFYITLSTVITLAASYVLMAYLTSHYGSTEAGYYQAGFTVISRYVGLVFSAIAMEYFPRLSGVADRKYLSQVFVSHEMKFSLLALVPIISIFIVIAPWAVSLLYSSEFLPIVPFIEIGLVGTIFRAVSWCMAFTMLVRGDGRIYLLTETVSAIIYILVNIFTFDTYGIQAMGYAYVVWYLVYAIVVAVVYFRRYRMRLQRGIVSVVAFALFAVLLTLGAALCWSRWAAAAVAIIVSAISIMFLFSKRVKLRLQSSD